MDGGLAKMDKHMSAHLSKVNKIEHKLGRTAKFVKMLDRWAVEEQPATLLGALMGILMLIGILIYAIVLAVLLAKGPPVETNKQQTTLKRSYLVDIQCVNLNAQPRSLDGDYGYGAEAGFEDDYFFDDEEGFICDDGSYVDFEEECPTYDICFPDTPAANGSCLCPDEDSQYYFSCFECDGCEAYLPPDFTCDDIVWENTPQADCYGSNYTKRAVTPTKKSQQHSDRSVKQSRSSPYFKAARDTCVVKMLWKNGSPCYDKSKKGQKDPDKVVMKSGETQTFKLCSVRAKKDIFEIEFASNTKVFLRGNDSDFEIYPLAGFTQDYFLQRFRSSDLTGSKAKNNDLWYGFPLLAKDTTTGNNPNLTTTSVTLKISPLFNIIYYTRAFSWLGWIGTISGVSNIFTTACGIILTVLMATLFRTYHPPEEEEEKRATEMADVAIVPVNEGKKEPES